MALPRSISTRPALLSAIVFHVLLGQTSSAVAASSELCPSSGGGCPDDGGSLLQLRLSTEAAALSAASLSAGSVAAAATSSCATSGREEMDLIEVLRSVSRGEFNTSLSLAWAKLQADILHAVRPPSSSTEAIETSRHLRILMVTPIKVSMLGTLLWNLEKLKQNKAGDEFKVALFYYHEPDNQLPTLRPDAEEALRPYVAFEKAGSGCKAEFWRHITPAMAKAYDYVWLLDADLRMDYFSWDLYRHYLFELDPIVSQPSILGWNKTVRSSDHFPLQMARQGNYSNVAVTVHEVPLIELQAPVLSAKLWPLVYERTMGVTGASGWALEGIWNAAAQAAFNASCTQVRGVVMNLSPLRHENCHDLGNSSLNHCVRSVPRQDCWAMSPVEAGLLKEALGKKCPRTVKQQQWQGWCICHCSEIDRLWMENTRHLRTWRVEIP